MRSVILGATFTAALAFAAASCGDPLVNGPGGTPCTDMAIAGVTVYVDSIDEGGSICDARVTLTGADGYRETLERFAGGQIECSYSGAWERPGTYTAEVTREGYETYRSAPVVVRRTTDGCHVEPVVLEIGLRSAVE